MLGKIKERNGRLPNAKWHSIKALKPHKNEIVKLHDFEQQSARTCTKKNLNIVYYYIDIEKEF